MSAGDDDSGTEAGEDIGLAETVHPPHPVAAAVTPPASTDTDPSRIAERPRPDKLQRAVARSRIADKLFAKKEEVKVGRFHLLEVVGSGGMGVVWGAWDPQLDRRVAIKLVRAEMSEAARERIRTEGQALARLSHPNVVPVYDVGVVDEQVYLVMEWVRGKNLRAYCKEPRTVREILAIYRAAGDGLAAAHRAGLIHRDFKPDNAMVGDDGRVRVLDFGLARGEVPATDPDSDLPKVGSPSSDLTRGAGTPRYMPPEQAEGQELTPAVDQYAFCVALREALVGRNADGKDADLPGWLDQLVDRGTARDPAKRFESMDLLLRALGRDPATVWRRRLVGAAVLGAAGIAFAIGTVRAGGAELEHCVGGKDEIARTWNAAARDKLTSHLRGLGAYGTQQAARIDGELGQYSERWASAHRAACMAKERGELTPQLYERNLGCLVRARAALGTVIDVLADVPVEGLPDALVAAQGLPDAARCASEAQASLVAPPPAHLEERATQLAERIESARILALAADRRAIEAARGAAATAAELGYLPLVARAQLVHGFALLAHEQRFAGIRALDQAIQAGLEAGDVETAIEAFARKIYAVQTSTDEADLPPNARDSLLTIGVMESMAKSLGVDGAFARALLYNNIGGVRLSAGDPSEARGWFERALAERDRATVGTVELSNIPGNLALVTDDDQERDRLLAQKGAELEAALGSDHPVTLAARVFAAMLVENPRESIALLRSPCTRYRETHGHLDDKISQCAYELGWLAEEVRDPGEVRTAMSEVRVPGIEREVAVGYLLMLEGKLAEAAAAMQAVVQGLGEDAHAWVRYRAVDALLLAASCEARLGRMAAATETLRRSIAGLEGVRFLESRSFYQRRLARARAGLARLLANTDPAAAAAYARAAIAWYRGATGYEQVIAELDRIGR